MAAPQSILVIDDEVEVGEFIVNAAAALGLTCTATTDVETFLQGLTPETSLILLDLLMPDTDGIELLRILAQRQCRIGIVLMSGVGKRVIDSAKSLATSLGLSIVGSLQKPFRLAELESILQTQKKVVEPTRPRPTVELNISDEELTQAIEQDQFLLHYQPQLNIATGVVVGLEALVRWNHPDRGLIFPDHFISRLESLGLIDRLGWIVANRGLSEVRQMASSKGVVPVLSINISAYSLNNLGFPDKFVALLRRHDMAPENVILEITESGLIQELSRALDVLTRLRMKQVKLSIDDFGTGYAMMQQLRLIPATEIKIDKSFVQNMHQSDSDRVMVEKTIEIGHELGMKVVAEGVETQEQLDFLSQSNCDIAQGYFFSRPLPLDKMVAWMREHQPWAT